VEPGEWDDIVDWSTLEWSKPEERNYGPLRCGVYFGPKLHVERAEPPPKDGRLPRQFLSVRLKANSYALSSVPQELQQLLLDLAYARRAK
jgi:hypothetical protein